MTSQQDTELEKILYAYRFDTQAINEDLVLQQNPTAVEKQHQEIIAEAIQALTSWKDKEVKSAWSDGYHKGWKARKQTTSEGNNGQTKSS